MIYQKRGQKATALDKAKMAYKLNSANMLAKNLIEQLGGEGALKGQKFQGRELMYLGDQYVRAGDFFSAQAQFKSAYDADPRNGGLAAMKAGKCLWQLNQTSDAIDWMNKAIRSDPQLISAYAELAGLLRTTI